MLEPGSAEINSSKAEIEYHFPQQDYKAFSEIHIRHLIGSIFILTLYFDCGHRDHSIEMISISLNCVGLSS